MKKKLVIGLSSKNESENIIRVTSLISDAIRQSKQTDLDIILCLADSSSDNTRFLFSSVKGPFQKEIIDIQQQGKGHAMYMLAKYASEIEADYLLYSDADLHIFDPKWISLSRKVIDEGNNVAFFSRKPLWDAGDLTKNVAIPIIAAGWGVLVREPIGGEFMIDKKAAQCIAKRNLPFYAEKYGIDIYVTTLLLENVKCTEIFLETHKGNSWRAYHNRDTAVTFGAEFIEVMQSAFAVLKRRKGGTPTHFDSLTILCNKQHRDLAPTAESDPDMDMLRNYLPTNKILQNEISGLKTATQNQMKEIFYDRQDFTGISMVDWLDILKEYYSFYKDKEGYGISELELRYLEVLFLARTYNEYMTYKGTDKWYTNIEVYADLARKKFADI